MMVREGLGLPLCTEPCDDGAGEITSVAVQQGSSETADSFETPEMPFPTEQSQCPADPAVVKVVGKRLDTGLTMKILNLNRVN
jgi:hypothetical protein